LGKDHFLIKIESTFAAMSDSATILIPDISGFTEFVSRTEIDHASHIVTELLELIISSNKTDLTLSEIEGDAVLFYRKGSPIPADSLVDQCLDMFREFHTRLRLIERDVICQCGACQTASDLTLKFVVHFGTIKEFSIRGFTKASGYDMIIAHRLLKNTIDSNEYILTSSSYLESAGHPPADLLEWLPYQATYPTIGVVECEFARLEALRSTIPAPPPRSVLPESQQDRTFEIDIAAPFEFVFDCLIDLDLRDRWTPGFRATIADPETARIGHHHVCVLDDFNVEFEVVGFDREPDMITFIEKGRLQGTEIGDIYHFRFIRQDDASTRLILEHSWIQDMAPPAEMVPEFHASMDEMLRLFKKLCEALVISPDRR
jgi:hypothetical protein